MTHAALYDQPRLVAAGDSAILVELGDGIDEAVNRAVHALAAAIDAAPPRGVRDVIPTYRSLLVCYDPLAADAAAIEQQIQDLWRHLDVATLPPPRELVIPTCYGGKYGPDLPFVAAHNHQTPERVVAIHSGGTYPVYMMGFSPGFAYLGGLDSAIATPRLQTPRTAIPAGSVGIAQRQTGIYPVESPGGWQLIGRTPARLFDASRTPPTLIVPGDRIRFVPIDEDQFRAQAQSGQGLEEPEPTRRVAPADSGCIVEVLSPGGLTTVQDLGRYGFQRYGVPVSGALDMFALRVANLLVGNEEGAAALEMTITGPELLFQERAVVAIGGADMQPRVDDAYAPSWTAFEVPAGSVVSFRGLRTGARAYLAIAGGIRVPEVLGSRSTYVRSHLGGLDGRPLRAGDRLPIASLGQRGVREANLSSLTYMGGHRLRVVMGPQQAAFTPRGIETLLSSAYTISPESDRMGYRLAGPRIELRASADIVSDGTPAGAVQVAGDGLPLLLLADRGTTGGYAKIATVIAADLPRVAQCRPGDRVFFDAVSGEDALAALRKQESVIEQLRTEPLVARHAPAVAQSPARASSATARNTEGSTRPATARAPLPGKVVQVNVQVGEPVERGQAMCILEAMKMHNAIAAPRAGRVAAVRVQVGDQVRDGQALVEIE